MKIGLSLNQEQVQIPSLKQSLNLRMETAEQLSVEAMELLENSPVGSEESFPCMVERVLESMASREKPEVIAAVRQYLEHPYYRIQLQKKAKQLTLVSPEQCDSIAVQLIREFQNGDFILPEGGNVNVTYSDLLDVLRQESLWRVVRDTDGAVQKILPYLKAGASDNTATLAYQRSCSLSDALALIPHIRPHIQSLSHVLQYLQNLCDEDQSKPFLDFFRYHVAMPHLAFVVSDRIQQRFASRFMDVRQQSSQDEFEIPFLNAIGEFVLVSMGIVDPRLFSVHNGEISDTKMDAAREMCSQVGVDLDQLMNHWKLTKEGTFFFSRYAMKGQRSCRVTDEFVRSFITQTVRSDQSAIIKASQFSDMFSRAKNIVASMGSKQVERSAAKTALCELFSDACSGYELKQHLLKQIQGPWFEHLSVFFPDSKQD